MQSILFISGFLPSARVPSGGQQLVHRELKRRCETGEVTLVAFRNEREASVDIADDFDACRQSHVLPLTRAKRAWGAIAHPMLPAITSARYAGARKLIASLLATHVFHEVHCEFIQAASLLSIIPAGIPATLVVHDFFHEALDRRARLHRAPFRQLLAMEARRTRRWESMILKRPAHLSTLTERDRSIAGKLSGRDDVAVRYPSFASQAGFPAIGTRAVIPGSVVFLGQMSRRENEDAAVWFIDSIWPEVVRARPHARLTIAGADPGPRLYQRQGAGISVTGYIESPSDLLRSAALSVAPLRMGSGIKIKVVQSLEAGIPTVATSIGAEGVRPSPLLHVAESAGAFASTCIRLLQ